MPKYLVKWPEEGAFLAALTAIALVVSTGMAEAGASAQLTGSVTGLLVAVARLAYGMLAPTPTVAQEMASVREAIDDVPKPPPAT